MNKLARKVTLDFIEGRLRYENPRDGQVDWAFTCAKAIRMITGAVKTE